MKKTFTVYGLYKASYDTPADGLFAVSSFDSVQDAESFVSNEYAQYNGVRSRAYEVNNQPLLFKQVVILPMYESA